MKQTMGDYFGIPRALISIDLFYSLLIPTAFLVFAAILYFGLKLPLIILIPIKVLRIVLFFVITFLLFFYIFRHSWSLILISWTFCIVLDSLFTYDSSNQDNAGVSELRKSLFFNKKANIEPKKNYIPFTLVMVAFLVLVLYGECGRIEASRKDKFLVTKNSKQTVAIIKVYNDKAICIPLDEKKQLIRQKFIILDIKSDLDREYTLERIGPFKPAPNF